MGQGLAPLGAGGRPECGGRSQAQTSVEAIRRASAQPLGRWAWYGDLGEGREPPGTPEPAHTCWAIPASEGLLRSLPHLRDGAPGGQAHSRWSCWKSRAGGPCLHTPHACPAQAFPTVMWQFGQVACFLSLSGRQDFQPHRAHPGLPP